MFYEVPIPTLIDLDTWETLPRHHGLYIKGLTFYLTGEISIPFETNLLSNPYLTHLLSGLDLPCYYLFDIYIELTHLRCELVAVGFIRLNRLDKSSRYKGNFYTINRARIVPSLARFNIITVFIIVTLLFNERKNIL